LWKIESDGGNGPVDTIAADEKNRNSTLWIPKYGTTTIVIAFNDTY